jgi:hypothetical protein
MKQDTTRILKASLLVMGMTGIANTACADDLNITPYIGAGMHFTHIGSPDSVTRTLYKGTVPGLNATLGLQFGEYLGLELGMEQNKTKKSENLLPLSANVPGLLTLPANYAAQGIIAINTTLKMQSINLDLIGRCPLSSVHTALENTSAFVGVGASRVNASTIIIPTYYEAPGVGRVVLGSSNVYKGHKIVPSVQVGISQNITSNLALQVSGQWRQLNKLNLVQKDLYTPLSFKNALTAKVKVLYSFN